MSYTQPGNADERICSKISESVTFRELSAVVVDEQHRFGVAQRLKLVDKAGVRAPHLLVMTATPIPRSLALVLYGDLEVSVIDALPPGRKPIITRRYARAARADAYRQLERALEAGGRAFVVCPTIRPGSKDQEEADDTGEAAAPTALVIFIHGGGFTGGSRSSPSAAAEAPTAEASAAPTAPRDSDVESTSQPGDSAKAPSQRSRDDGSTESLP